MTKSEGFGTDVVIVDGPVGGAQKRLALEP